MAIFYTSDLHYHHKNVCHWDKMNWDASLGEYPFADYMERDAGIIERWNSRIGGNDIVYILGDVCYGKRDDFIELLSALKGRKHIVLGNHDKQWMREYVGYPGLNLKSVSDYLILSDSNCKVVLSHFPILCWDGQHRGSYHVYGHVHGSAEERIFQEAGKLLEESGVPEFRAMNAGCMMWDFYPVTFEEMRLAYGVGKKSFDRDGF